MTTRLRLRAITSTVTWVLQREPCRILMRPETDSLKSACIALMRQKTSSDGMPRPCNVPPQLSSLGHMNTLAPWAEHFAQALLKEPLPRRWAHVQGVATRARNLAPVHGAGADLLEAAAWLHDIGYAPGLAVTGLHALDGARYLRDAQNADACYASSSPITPTPSSKPTNADLPTP
jgi:HD domain